MNRMEEVSVRKHQRHRSLLSLLPTPLLSCLQLSGPSCLFKAALTPQLSCHSILVPVHPFIHPSPLFFFFLYLTFQNHVTVGFYHPPQKGDFHFDKGLQSKTNTLPYKKIVILPCQDGRMDFGEPHLAHTSCARTSACGFAT